MRHKLSILVIVACLPCAADAGELPQRKFELYKQVVAGHLSSRSALRSGVWRATGKMKYRQTRDGQEEDVETEVRLFGAFDSEGGRVRCDRDEPQPPLAKGKRSVGIYPHNHGGKYIKTPEFVANQRIGGSSVTVKDPSDNKPLSGTSPIAVRACGSLNFHEMDLGMTLEEAFGKDGGRSETSVADVVEEPGGVVRITWTIGPTNICRRTIWFSQDRGYAPERFEECYRKRNAEGTALAEPPEYADAECAIAVTWAKTADVWLPSTASIKQTLGARGPPNRGESARTYSLSFKWESVNAPVADRYFTVEDFDDATVRPGIVDYRRGDQPVIVRPPR
jgi:hypothetical protein